MNKKSLLRKTSSFAGMTFISRIFGFIRDMVAAHIFGAGAAADAFFVAFRIPNFMRRLFAEGAFSQAFVPVLAEFAEQKSAQESKDFFAAIFGALACVLFMVVLVAEIASPFIVSIFAPGFLDDPSRFALTTHMIRLTFPYLMLISLTACVAAVLNTKGFFAIPALTPVLLNFSLIGTALWLAPVLEVPIVALAWGVFIAGIVQFLFQIPLLWKIGFLVKPRIAFKDPGVRRVLKLMVPALFGASVVQLNLMLDTIFASFLQIGSVSWLYYSDRLMEFPLGVFGVAIATVILPSLSRKRATNSSHQVASTIYWALRSVLLVGVPASAGLYFFGGPLLATLFFSGQFKAHDVLMSSLSLKAFAMGLPAFMLIKILASVYYSAQDIKTPVKIAFLAMLVNTALNFVLIKPFAHMGLAMATTIAAYVNVALLLLGLFRRHVLQWYVQGVYFVSRLSFAVILMVVAIRILSPNMQAWFESSVAARLWQCSYVMSVAMLTYFLVLWGVGVRKADFVRDAF